MDALKDEIKEFLTSRRARITPRQVGLSLDHTARRVPGLRREEVADLAGISTEYYVVLERGNLKNASPQVLAGVARALLLDEDETTYLHHLARVSRAGSDAPDPLPASTVTPRIQSVVDSFSDGPAWVRNDYMDILATNGIARVLYDPIFTAIPERPNTARHLFLAPGARQFWLDADYYAEAFAAKLRMESAARAGDPQLESLVDELTRHSEQFRTHWSGAEVNLFRNGIKRFAHPVAGRLEFHFETMDLNSAPGLVLSVYLPADRDTAERLTVLQRWAVGMDPENHADPGDMVF